MSLNYLRTMRTTVRLNEQLLTQAKKYAYHRGLTLTSLIEDALRKLLTQVRKKEKIPTLRLTTFKGKGLQAGVDLDHMSELLDRMEKED